MTHPKRAVRAAAAHVPPAAPSPFDLAVVMSAYEQQYLRNILTLVNGNLEQAAELVGLSRAELLAKLNTAPPPRQN